MSLAQRFERRLESVVGSAFARVFKGQVEPVEVGNALQREAGDKRSVMPNGQVYAPNRYRVSLSGSDFERLLPWEAQLTTSLAELVQEFLDDNGWTTVGDIEVYLHRDDALHTGVFGIASRMEAEAPPRQRPYDSLSLPVVAGAPPGSYPHAFDPAVPRPPRHDQAPQNGYPPDQYGQGQYRPEQYQQGQYAQAGYDPYQQQGAYPPDQYGQGQYPPNQYEQAGYGQGQYAPDAYGQGQYEQQGHEQQGHEQQGQYDPNSQYGQGQYPPGAYGQAGWAPPGYADAGQPQQGYDQQGYDHQGYDQHGYDQQGYANQGHQDPGPPPFSDLRQPRIRGWLTVDGTDRALELRRGSNVIGRGQDCDLQLLDQGVSRRHVDVQFDGEVTVAYDLGSTNGTAVNGHPVGSSQLQHGDVLRVGHTRLVYHQEDP